MVQLVVQNLGLGHGKGSVLKVQLMLIQNLDVLFQTMEKMMLIITAGERLWIKYQSPVKPSN